MKKKLIMFLACCCVLTENTAYADNLSMSATTQTSLVTDTNVRVINYVDDAEVVLYTGPISQFENGEYASMDFAGKDFAVIFEWGDELELLYYIYPTATSEQNTSATETQQSDIINSSSYQANTLSENIISNEAGITFSSQIKINGVSTGEEGLRIVDDANLQCTFNVTNSTNEEKDITLLLATYDDNKRMVNVKKSDVKVPANLSGDINLVYQFDAETEKNAKLMLWHSGIMPVRASIDFSGNSGVNAYYYDANNRLVQIDKKNGVSISYTYDKMGNLLTKTVIGGEEDA